MSDSIPNKAALARHVLVQVPHDVLAAGVRGFQQWVIDTEKATADIKEEYKNLVHQEFQGADEVERLRSSVALAQKNLNSVEEELKSCKAKDRTRLNRTRKETAQALAECEKTYNERHSGLITLRGRIRDVQTELAKHPDPWVLLLCTEWLCRPTKHADFLTGQIVGQQPELPFNADRVLWRQCARLAILHDKALPDEELRTADGILDGAKVDDVWVRMTMSWEVWGPVLQADLNWVKAGRGTETKNEANPTEKKLPKIGQTEPPKPTIHPLINCNWTCPNLDRLHQIDQNPTRKGIEGNKTLLKRLKEFLTRHDRRDIAETLSLEDGRIKTTLPHRSIFPQESSE
jgi:hypothetical protein